jgi:hypothetical protein
LNDSWDRQIESDLTSGKLDIIIAKAEADIAANSVRDLSLSFTTSNFWEAYATLSPKMKEQAQKAYYLWKENSLHPSLHFKKVDKNLWSVRLTGDYRAL